MPLDFAYVDGDNRFEDGNYVQISGVSAKIARAVRMHRTTIDGRIVGNPGWQRVSNMGNTATARAVWKRSVEETLAPFVDSQMIADLEVTVDAGQSGAVLTQIRYRDLLSGAPDTVLVPSPWSA